MNKKEVTMADIAEALNISVVSVHKALNNQLGISPELKERIIKMSVQLGYKQVDPLLKYCRHFIFVIHKKFTFSYEQFYMGIYNRIADMLTHIGAKMEMLTVDETFDMQHYINRIESHSKDNFVFFLTGALPADTYKVIEKLKLPAICIDYHSLNYNFDYVLIDNYRAAYFLTEYLLKLGHRKICMILSTKTEQTNIDKYFGFRKALLVNNIDFTEDMHMNVNIMDNRSFSQLDLPQQLPTAFMCDSDQAAYFFLLKLQAFKIRIPQDVSVTGFDNCDICSEAYPTLTSIGASNYDISAAAYSTILRRLEKPSTRHETTFIKPKLVIRNSTAANASAPAQQTSY